MEGVPSPSFLRCLRQQGCAPTPPQPSDIPPHTQLTPGTWSPPCLVISSYLLNTLQPCPSPASIPDRTSPRYGWAAMAKCPDPAGLCSLFAWHWHAAPMSCRCCNTPCLYVSKIVSTIIPPKILFQINNCKNEGDWKSTTVGIRQIFFWETQVSKLVYPQLLKPFPLLCPPPLYLDFFPLRFFWTELQNFSFFPSWSSRRCFISRRTGAPLLLTRGVLSPWEVSVLALAPQQFVFYTWPFHYSSGTVVLPPLSTWGSRSPPMAKQRVKGCDFRGKFWQPCTGRYSSPSPGPNCITCACKTLSITGLNCFFSGRKSVLQHLMFISRNSRLLKVTQ